MVAEKGDVYIEFVVMGAVAKVTAIDPTTGMEVSIVGPSSAPRATLVEAATRKLRYAQQKKRDGA